MAMTGTSSRIEICGPVIRMSPTVYVLPMAVGNRAPGTSTSG